MMTALRQRLRTTCINKGTPNAEKKDANQRIQPERGTHQGCYSFFLVLVFVLFVLFLILLCLFLVIVGRVLRAFRSLEVGPLRLNSTNTGNGSSMYHALAYTAVVVIIAVVEAAITQIIQMP